MVHGSGASDVLAAVPGQLLMECRVGLCGLVGFLQLPGDKTRRCGGGFIASIANTKGRLSKLFIVLAAELW